MSYNSDGSWYYAVKYESKEAAIEFLGRLKSALARDYRTENIFSMSFSTSQKGLNCVVAFGYPEPETTSLVKSMFEKSAIRLSLSRRDLAYVMQEAEEARRQAREKARERALQRASERMREKGGSEAITDAGAEGRGKPSSAMPGLQVGTQRKIQRIPFIINYRDLQARTSEQTPSVQNISTSKETWALEKAMRDILSRKLECADKYQFDLSAIALLDAVRDLTVQSWLPLKNNLWIEFSQGLKTPHGEDIRALWVHAMDAESDIQEVTPASFDLDTHRLMIEQNMLYATYWSFDVINGHGSESFGFTYDIAQGKYVFLHSHVCPNGACTYPVPGTRYTLGKCNPCFQCESALAYWASMLHTTIRIIRREFALAPEEPPPYSLISEIYPEEAQAKEGERHTQKTVMREVDYRLVSFEVSEILAAAQETIKREESEGKHLNWLKLADKEAIIWEYREIDTSGGRTLDPRRNPRWKSYQRIEIAPFKKWVPMLAHERKTIKKVTARRYATQHKKDS